MPESAPAADWSWQDGPNVISWDWRQGPDLDELGRLLARHRVTMTEVDTGTDDVAVRIGSTPVEVMEGALCRRVWAAALRWAANCAAKPFGQVQDGDLDSTDLRQMAGRIEAGTLTPWAETPADPPRIAVEPPAAPDPALADQTSQTPQQPGHATGAPVSWLTIDDTDTARTLLADLVDWLTRVYAHYPAAVDALGECWPWHPTAVEELLALRAGWHAAYTSPDATAARALDWHDRHLPGTLRRLRAALADCSQPAHQPGGRADHLCPTIPATTHLDQLAGWWATSHGTTSAPLPREHPNHLGYLLASD